MTIDDGCTSILVLIPVHNEEATIGNVIRELQQLGLSQIRVIDNGSTDASASIAKQMGTEVIWEPIPGYGQACWRGLQHLPSTIEWILFCDGDGSDDLSELPIFLAACDSYDLILGNRQATTEGKLALTPAQRFGNTLATRLIRWGWGGNYYDLGPLRLIRRSALKALQLRDRNFGWTVEMQIRAVECGCQILELPVNYRPRQGGRSKISGTIWGSIRAGMVILRVVGQLYFKRLMRQWSRHTQNIWNEFFVS